jgi:hypothetical protein
MADGHAFNLDKKDAAFLRIEHLSILGASRGTDNIPFVARAIGCRISSDLRQVTLYFAKSDAREAMWNYFRRTKPHCQTLTCGSEKLRVEDCPDFAR